MWSVQGMHFFSTVLCTQFVLFYSAYKDQLYVFNNANTEQPVTKLNFLQCITAKGYSKFISYSAELWWDSALTVHRCEGMQCIYFLQCRYVRRCSSFISTVQSYKRDAVHLFSTVQSCKEMQFIYFYSAELHKGCSSFISTVPSYKEMQNIYFLQCRAAKKCS